MRTATRIRIRKRSIKNIIKAKIRKIFYKVADDPLFKQRMISFVLMFGGLFLYASTWDEYGASLLMIAFGLWLFRTKKNLFDDPDNE